MIEEGRYPSKAVKWDFAKIGMNGTPCIRVVMQVRSHFMVWDGWLTERSVESTLKALRAMGWDGKSLSKPEGIGSQPCSVTVENEINERNGESYPRIKWVNPPGPPLKPEYRMPSVEINSLDSKFSGLLTAPSYTNEDKAAINKAKAAFGKEDDVPF